MNDQINPIKHFRQILNFDTKSDYQNIFSIERFEYKRNIKHFIEVELKDTAIDFSKYTPLTRPPKEKEEAYYKHHEKDEMVLIHYTRYMVRIRDKEQDPLLTQILLNPVEFPNLGKTFYNYRLFKKLQP